MKRTLSLLALFICFATLAFAGTAEDEADPYFAKVKAGDTEYVKGRLSAETVQINDHEASSGKTALIIAVDNDDLAMVMTLIPFLPDPAEKDVNNRTAYTAAKERGNVAVISALENAGITAE